MNLTYYTFSGSVLYSTLYVLLYNFISYVLKRFIHNAITSNCYHFVQPQCTLFFCFSAQIEEVVYNLETYILCVQYQTTGCHVRAIFCQSLLVSFWVGFVHQHQWIIQRHNLSGTVQSLDWCVMNFISRWLLQQFFWYSSALYIPHGI